jgi:hypothetical protein
VGFFDNLTGIVNRIRTAWSKDKEQVAVQLAKGDTASTAPQGGHDSLQTFGYNQMQDYLRLEHDYLGKLNDYLEMDEYPTISAALDIYSDDASQLDHHRHHKIWVTSPDKEAEEALNYFLHKTLRADEDIPSIARALAQDGNVYEELIVTEDGVVGTNNLPAATVRRIEGERGELYGFVQDVRGRFNFSVGDFQDLLKARSEGKPVVAEPSRYGQDPKEKVVAFEGWQVLHFRLQTRRRRTVYGSSMLEPVRWLWKRLVLLEDSAMIYRLQRGQERFAFYVDVGDLPPQEALAWLNRVRQQFKKKKFINAQGKLDLKIDLICPEDDLYIPVRKGAEGTRVEVLGSPNWQSVDDLTFFEDKMFTGLKIPKAYLAQDDSSSRSTLSQQDVRFARTILRLQGAVKDGYSKACRIHLAAIGIDPEDIEFSVHMTVPSALFEQAQLETLAARADLAARMGEFVSLRWILSEVFDLNDDEISVLIQEREEDKIRDFVSEARAQSAAVAEFPQFQQGAPAAAFAPQPGFDQGGDSGGQPPEGQPPNPPGDQVPPGGGEPPQTASAKPKRPPIYSSISTSKAKLSRSKARELSESKDRDRRLHEKLSQLRSNDNKLDKRLTEISMLLRDLQLASKRSRSNSKSS